MATSSEIVEQLRRWGSLKVGERFPADLGGPDGWDPPLTKLLNDAADEIERLDDALSEARTPRGHEE